MSVVKGEIRVKNMIMYFYIITSKSITPQNKISPTKVLIHFGERERERENCSTLFKNIQRISFLLKPLIIKLIIVSVYKNMQATLLVFLTLMSNPSLTIPHSDINTLRARIGIETLCTKEQTYVPRRKNPIN